MNKTELIKLISEGENENVEFKSSFQKKVIISLVSFANKSGGMVIVGVKDNGEITGLTINSEIIQEQVNEIKKTTYLQIVPNVFNDKIEFYNPGGLQNNLSIEDIVSGNYSSLPRNKQIASVFKEAGVIEKYGSGIKGVMEEFESYGLPKPEFRANSSDFYVPVFLSEKTTKKILVNGGVNNVLEFIRGNPGKRTVEISEKLLIPKRTVERYIKQLKENDSIEFRGVPKTGGYWEIKNINKKK